MPVKAARIRYNCQRQVGINGDIAEFEGKGNGPIDAFVKGFNQHSSSLFFAKSYSEHDIDRGSGLDARLRTSTFVKAPDVLPESESDLEYQPLPRLKGF